MLSNVLLLGSVFSPFYKKKVKHFDPVEFFFHLSAILPV